jgi:hypothetical protein
MGWKLKGLAVLFALAFLAAALWQLSLLIFAALLLPPLVRRLTRGAGDRKPDRVRRFPIRQAIGGFLLLLSLVAFAGGGTLSPLFFGGLGLLLLLWGRIPSLSLWGNLRPVKDSILLRASLIPFHWTAVVEVKPMTHDLGKALSGIGEPMLLHASGTPSIHIVVNRMALSERSAEEAILEAVERIGRGVVPLGAYLLPLDSGQAFSLLREPLRSERTSDEGWALALSTGAYDVLSVESAKGFARSFGLYRRAVGEGATPHVPIADVRFDHPPLLWEVFKSLEGRVQWPNPDRYTAFLSSIFATGSESIGSNIIDAGTPSPTDPVVAVRSHSSPAVELSRVQLRAIVAIYSQGPPVVVNKAPVNTPAPEATPVQ